MCPQRICIYPTLRESMQTELDTPHIFLPDKVPIISPHESQQLHEMTMPTLQTLDNIQSRLATPLHAIDIDSLMHVHQSAQGSQTEIRWYTIAFILTTSIVLLGLGYFILRLHFDKLRCAATKTLDPLSATSPQASNSRTTTERQQNVLFSSYELQNANWYSHTGLCQSDPQNASPIIAKAAKPISGSTE